MLRYSLLILHVIISINLVTVNCDQNTDLSVPSISQTHTKSGKQSDCKYMKGTWSACSNGIRSREDTLRVSHSVSNCNNTRTIHKKCKNGKFDFRRNFQSVFLLEDVCCKYIFDTFSYVAHFLSMLSLSQSKMIFDLLLTSSKRIW
uniref:Pleiotrophin/Midkine C-terminal domain-containing protein n=1 Tax=Tetranychus urticae TaxID=32264 RepID=T1KG89_TETUR